MIAKGLDFPNVTLVGVIDADVGMNVPDFRAAERSFQLMAQVAGRAGVGRREGWSSFKRVSRPTTPSVPRWSTITGASCRRNCSTVSSAVSAHGASGKPGLQRHREAETMAAADRGAAFLTKLITGGRVETVHVIGPAPCPIERISRAGAGTYYARQAVHRDDARTHVFRDALHAGGQGGWPPRGHRS
jgi:primosomal protein N' (replication factor Y)